MNTELASCHSSDTQNFFVAPRFFETFVDLWCWDQLALVIFIRKALSSYLDTDRLF
jgi:hypothetical protein